MEGHWRHGGVIPGKGARVSRSASPNILIICCDQLRPFELGCHGHPVVQTPNIDALAARGVRFETACTPNPLCSPARGALLSGQYSRTCTGMLGNVGEPVQRRCQFPDTTLPERLAVAGYKVALTGVWHSGPHPHLLGFEETGYPKFYHLNTGQTYFDGKGRSWSQEGYGPDFELGTTRRFLQRDHDRPFFLLHNIAQPHMPYFDMPDRFLRRYEPDQAVLRPNTIVDGKPAHDENWFKIYRYDYLYYQEKRPDMQDLPPGYDLRSLTAEYYGMIAAVDDQVGILMASLDETGHLDNTVVVFTSDHGENLGSHGRFNKHSVNDEAVRVPLLFSGPGGIRPGVNTAQVGSLVDIAPTLLSIAGQPVPASMQGQDLSPILRGERDSLDDPCAVVENVEGEIAIRTPTHLYAMMTEPQHGAPEARITNEQLMFYDLRSDPYEMSNLAGSGVQPEIAGHLKQRLLEWDRQTPWMPGSKGGPYGQGPME